MAVYVRAKEMLFTLKFPMDDMEDVANSVHLMIAKGEIMRVSLGEFGTDLINFGALTHVSISSISREEMAADASSTPAAKVELVATLGTDGGLSIADQAEDYLKGQGSPE